MAPCASPKQYRSLARPSSAAEPSHPPDGVVTACSRRLDFRPGIFCVWLDNNWPTYCYTEAYATSSKYKHHNPSARCMFSCLYEAQEVSRGEEAI